MKIDITVIKNESVIKLEKSLKSVKQKFNDMLSLALDTAIHEIDNDKRKQVEVVINDMINDESNQLLTKFTHCMNRVSDLVQNELA